MAPLDWVEVKLRAIQCDGLKDIEAALGKAAADRALSLMSPCEACPADLIDCTADLSGDLFVYYYSMVIGLFSRCAMLVLLFFTLYCVVAAPAFMRPRAVPQVVGGRVTGMAGAPPPIRDFWSPTWLLGIIAPLWELLRLLKRVLFDALRVLGRWASRAVAAARNSSLVRGPSAVALTTAPVQPDRLTALARAIDVRAFEYCDGRSLARLEVVSRTFRAPRDDAFRGQKLRHSFCEAVAWRSLVIVSEGDDYALVDHDFDASQPLGVTLKMMDDGRAAVNSILSQGQAEGKGVRVGDVVVTLDGSALNFVGTCAGIAAAKSTKPRICVRFARPTGQLTFGDLRTCAWKTRVLERYCVLRAAGGQVSSLDRYVYLDAVLRTERPEYGDKDATNHFHAMHGIVKANPGPIPTNVQTALFFAAREKQQETDYFKGLSRATQGLLQLAHMLLAMFVVQYVVCGVLRYLVWDNTFLWENLGMSSIASAAGGGLWFLARWFYKLVLYPAGWMLCLPIRLSQCVLLDVPLTAPWAPFRLIVEYAFGVDSSLAKYLEKEYQTSWCPIPW